MSSRATAALDLVVAGGNYSYTANTEYHGNLDDQSAIPPYSAACHHITGAGFTHTYLVPFRNQPAGPVDFPEKALQPDTGMTLGGLPFGSSTLTPELLQSVKTSLDEAGLKISTLLVLMSGVESIDPVKRYRLVIDQAASLGVSFLIDFGLHDPEEYDGYVALMRTVAPYAQAKGLAISMKLHATLNCSPSTILDRFVAIHEAIDHPAFGLCMDPGNIIYFTAPKNQPEGADSQHRLPTEGLVEVAHRFNTMIIKDCVIGPTPGEVEEPERSANPVGTPDVIINPGTGLVDFHAVLK